MNVLTRLYQRPEAPAIYKTLYEQVDSSEAEITIDLMSGRGQNNFNFATKTASFNALTFVEATNTNDQSLLRFVYAMASHELRHAYDVAPDRGGLSLPSHAATAFADVENLYITELQAWHSEARAYLESGDYQNELVQGWLTLNADAPNEANAIWARIVQYTENSFKGYFPAGWTWASKVRHHFLASEKIKARMKDLQARLKGRVASAAASSADATAAASSSPAQSW